MGECVIASVSFNGFNKLVCIGNNTELVEVVDQLNSSSKEWSINNLSARCKVGDLCNVFLESKDDLKNIMYLSKLLGVKVIYMEVLNECIESIKLGIDDFSGPGALKPVENSNLISMDDEICNEGLNPVILLSDGWGELMKGGVGLKFTGGVEEFRVALIKYSFKKGFRFSYVRNTSERVIVVCYDAKKYDCKWHIKAKLAPDSEAFVVDQVDYEHTCCIKMARAACHNSMCPRLMAHLLVPNAKMNSKFKASDVIYIMKLGYAVDIPYWKARRAAEYARELVLGSHEESYDKLRCYCEAVRLSNPGSITLYESDSYSNTFQRVYISFAASIKGFASCPPMLFVDGTFLRDNARGTMLIAVAKDANNGLFPVAFAIVAAENTENWCWFLSLIRDTLKHDKKICFLSDRNAGLLAALPLVFESPVHFYCLYHLLSNLRGKCKIGVSKGNRKLIVKLFKECAYAPNKFEFANSFNKFISVGGPIVKEWASQLPFEKWALSFCINAERYGEMTSNAAESFNSWVVIARTKPVSQLFEHIRKGLGKWFVERRKVMMRWNGLLVPNKQFLWEKMVCSVACWTVVLCPAGDYEVFSSPSVRVDIKTRTCSCYKWQYYGFPCCHAAAVIMKEYSTLNLELVDSFLASKFEDTYSHDINPVPESLIIECQLLVDDKVRGPPILGRPAGRPKNHKRIASIGEFCPSKKKINNCSSKAK